MPCPSHGRDVRVIGRGTACRAPTAAPRHMGRHIVSAESVRVGSSAATSPATIEAASHRGPQRRLLSQFLANRSATLGAAIILILSALALFAPQIAPHPYAEQSLLDSLLKP